MILWTLDPAERDAVLANEAARKWQPGNRVLVEIACTRTSAQVFAARQAYHERFKRSLEEDIAAHVTGDFRKVMRSRSRLFFHACRSSLDIAITTITSVMEPTMVWEVKFFA